MDAPGMVIAWRTIYAPGMVIAWRTMCLGEVRVGPTLWYFVKGGHVRLLGSAYVSCTSVFFPSWCKSIIIAAPHSNEYHLFTVSCRSNNWTNNNDNMIVCLVIENCLVTMSVIVSSAN